MRKVTACALGRADAGGFGYPVVTALLAGLVALGSSAAGAVEYEEIQSIFSARCTVCHSGANALGGLALDSHAGVLAGSDRGPVLDPADPGNSELLRRIRGEAQPRMPLTGPPWLEEFEITKIEAWIARGAAGPASPAAVRDDGPGGAPEPGALSLEQRLAAKEPVTWADVEPVLARYCVKCHATQGLMGPAPERLVLSTHEQALAADERARVVPGQAGASELLRRIRGQAQPRMPMDGPPFLEETEIALIERWINEGARDADGRPTPVPFGARVRLHGTLASPHHLDGLELRLDSSTRIDKSPGVGDRVQVRGRIAADGAIVVERLRPRD